MQFLSFARMISSILTVFKYETPYDTDIFTNETEHIEDIESLGENIEKYITFNIFLLGSECLKIDKSCL